MVLVGATTASRACAVGRKQVADIARELEGS
jgi:hypothetical protein